MKYKPFVNNYLRIGCYNECLFRKGAFSVGYLFSILIGYLAGCFSPAKILSVRRDVDLKETGTTNLGATNTAIVLGFGSGLLVMVLDILKAVVAYHLCAGLFPETDGAGLAAGAACILGHCFPVFLKFRGGKGLASFGGMVLAFSPKVFLAIVIPAVALMVILNTGVVVPLFAGVTFPVFVWLRGGTLRQIIIAVAAGTFLIGMHVGNLKKFLAGKDYVSTREFFSKYFPKKHS